MNKNSIWILVIIVGSIILMSLLTCPMEDNSKASPYRVYDGPWWVVVNGTVINYPECSNGFEICEEHYGEVENCVFSLTGQIRSDDEYYNHTYDNYTIVEP